MLQLSGGVFLVNIDVLALFLLWACKLQVAVTYNCHFLGDLRGSIENASRPVDDPVAHSDLAIWHPTFLCPIACCLVCKQVAAQAAWRDTSCISVCAGTLMESNLH